MHASRDPIVIEEDSCGVVPDFSLAQMYNKNDAHQLARARDRAEGQQRCCSLHAAAEFWSSDDFLGSSGLHSAGRWPVNGEQRVWLSVDWMKGGSWMEWKGMKENSCFE